RGPRWEDRPTWPSACGRADFETGSWWRPESPFRVCAVRVCRSALGGFRLESTRRDPCEWGRGVEFPRFGGHVTVSPAHLGFHRRHSLSQHQPTSRSSRECYRRETLKRCPMAGTAMESLSRFHHNATAAHSVAHNESN